MKKILMFVLVLLIFVPLAFGMPGVKQWRLAWDANTETDLAGYKVYWRTEIESYADNMSQDVGNVLNCPLSNLPLASDVTYYFVLTAYDTSENESDFSNEVAHFLDQMTPGVPVLRLEKM